jgi:hypothetical protein
MTNKTIEKQRAARIASKQDRDREAVTAMQEYEAGKAAVLAKTARLRAMRLAKEANTKADEEAAGAAAAAAKSAAKRRPAAKKKAPKR